MASATVAEHSYPPFSNNGQGGFRINHARISEEDFSWLSGAYQLELWNVEVPAGFLARMPQLWFLDVRGSFPGPTAANGAENLEFLRIMHSPTPDLEPLPNLRNLRYLDLHALANVTHFPNLLGLRYLVNVELGQMIRLQSVQGLLAAPNLLYLNMMKRLPPLSSADVELIRSHPKLRRFNYSGTGNRAAGKLSEGIRQASGGKLKWV